MIRLVLGILIVFSLGAPLSVSCAPPPPATLQYPLLPSPGEKVALDGGYYFTYGFSSQPKLGTAIMRVEIYNRDGNRDTSFVVRGDTDMPSMRGAHSTGDHDFSLSAKGVYLLPVLLVMPGDWEIRFTFLQQGKEVFRGAYLFDL